MAGYLRLVTMPTEEELKVIRARRAWWLRVARLADPRHPTLGDAAVAAGLDAGSGSVVSLWEANKQKGEGPKESQLRRLASFYGLPFTLFVDPPETDEERLARLRELALSALEQEQADWDAELGAGRESGAVAGAPLGRRSA